ncbi:galactosylceramide sulfotransferase-like isoform X2 [Rhopalosiphum maidis]|uniref:galactosylceramide sulfotransferase-like isoform X2 n=1 Tax=Rhopalosiphum maidis TaxID=43146 RepID=UPI000EFF90D8|nr:galactosylceramide sulfotransferase-like isoform X2 [Rhopalosiphum maidis]
MRFIKIKYCFAYIVILLTLITFLISFNFIPTGFEHRTIIESKSLSSATVIEKKRIFFLKTHKCASSTVQNILMRFGHMENLDFLLPTMNNYIGNPMHFNTSMISNKYLTVDGKFDMFVHHTRYSQEIKSVMRSGTVYVTILREPTALFQSLYSFYHFDKKYKCNLTEFITTRISNKSSANHIKRYNNKLGINQMNWDLGMVTNDFENIDMINKHINIIERDFDFVMIFEYLDASLVLFAHFMRWPLEKMAYLPLNSRNNTYKEILSNNNVRRLQQINMADNMLYQRFLLKFKEMIKKYGIEKLKKGIKRLMSINQEILEMCVQSVTNKGYARTISYKLKANTNAKCKYIAINELKYTSYLREIQYEKQKKYNELDKLMNNN